MPWNKDGSRKSAYTKKSSGFKMNGMGFGVGTGAPGMPGEDQYQEMAGAFRKDYEEKKTSRTGLFGRRRDVTKYFDPETGKKVGKEVKITKRGRSKPVKVKTKKTSLGDPSVIGKWNVKEGYFRNKKASESTAKTKPTSKNPRPDWGASKPELKEFVSQNQQGENKLASYDEAWDDGRFTIKDGKRTDKFGNVYTDDQAGKEKFIQASEKYWDDVATKTGDERYRESSQKYKRFGRKRKKKR